METSPSALGSGVASGSEAGLLSAISESTTGAADLLLAISGYVGGKLSCAGRSGGGGVQVSYGCWCGGAGVGGDVI